MRRVRTQLTAVLLITIGVLAAPGTVLGLRAPAGRGATIAGTARVVDGDTLRIGRTRIRLEAIDAPEKRQKCRVGGETWACGERAAAALRDLVGGRPLTCRPSYKDRYGRDVATCSVGGVDLGAWLVSRGWALAYRRYGEQYVAEEDAARKAGLGVWRGAFVPPWDERRGRHDEVDAVSY